MTILSALNYCTFYVSVSVLAETKTFFRYRFRPKRKMAVSASFGFGRNEKKPFGRTLYSAAILFHDTFVHEIFFNSISRLARKKTTPLIMKP